ncbi:MAG: carboxypeptidase-like regulatory domain-containing protein, partial [Muribaculaceae bacterium]|nr:carboxypeptidase-like regulatory domain-containing protein [Muribaculaceae bacterium]
RVTNRRLDPGNSENDIQTQLLLQSELRGRIENPRYYFNSSDRERERNLDLLMMVNGWSRYNIPHAIQGKYEEPTIPLEIGQEISGQVRSRWKNSPMEGVMVSAIVPQKNFGTFADTDSNGIFHLNGFDFPEGTPFILKAMNEKGGLEANYDIFEDRFPATESLPPLYSSASTEEISDFFKGSRWILLDEVKVQAFKESNDDIYANFSSYTRTADDMKVRGITSVEQALRGIGGITNHMGHLKWRYSEISYFIDGQLFDPRGNATMMYNVAGQRSPWISNAHGHKIGGNTFYGPTLSEVSAAVPFNIIERIDFIRPEHSLVLGPSYGGPTVVITTKKGDKVHWERQFELKDYLPLGYQQYKEYASPILSVDTDEYDLQTKPTLLWLPSVKFDGNGKSIDLKFPIKSDYRVIVEGVADNGDIISESLSGTR